MGSTPIAPSGWPSATSPPATSAPPSTPRRPPSASILTSAWPPSSAAGSRGPSPVVVPIRSEWDDSIAVLDEVAGASLVRPGSPRPNLTACQISGSSPSPPPTRTARRSWLPTDRASPPASWPPSPTASATASAASASVPTTRSPSSCRTASRWWRPTWPGPRSGSTSRRSTTTSSAPRSPTSSPTRGAKALLGHERFADELAKVVAELGDDAAAGLSPSARSPASALRRPRRRAAGDPARRSRRRGGDALHVGHDRTPEGRQAGPGRHGPRRPRRAVLAASCRCSASNPATATCTAPARRSTTPPSCCGRPTRCTWATRSCSWTSGRPRACSSSSTATGSRRRTWCRRSSTGCSPLPEDVRARYDCSSVRCMVHAAAPCPPEVKRRMIEWWGDAVDGVLRGHRGRRHDRHRRRSGSSGPAPSARRGPAPRSASSTTPASQLPTGEIGTVYMSLAQANFEYKGDAKKTKANRIHTEDGGAFFTVGDVGVLDEDGYLFLRDRKIDMIISGGVNIYPGRDRGRAPDPPEGRRRRRVRHPARRLGRGGQGRRRTRRRGRGRRRRWPTSCSPSPRSGWRRTSGRRPSTSSPRCPATRRQALQAQAPRSLLGRRRARDARVAVRCCAAGGGGGGGGRGGGAASGPSRRPRQDGGSDLATRTGRGGGGRRRAARRRPG